ncbi:TIGR02117 family protein [Altererythrobacter sp. ZODW24]|uniref:TIGR02117 family protein n=1 Tax=Altererythrobacter sp. ZODW24 TaxID=2185142 RepID=UPI000DF861E9|nr:TIGR02117 family protein [Altererythrobacter sp. ZODW24]
MAAQAHLLLSQKLARTLKWLVAGLATVATLFLLTAWIGSAIPRNSDWAQPSTGVEIMVETNSVHTALVLPLVSDAKDWRSEFPASDVDAAHLPYTHVSISWGEREVFLNTPTWSDLSPMTALRIVGVGGEGLLHIAHYVRPAPSDDLRPMRITDEQYRQLVAEIERSIGRNPERKSYPGYNAQDVFYDAPGEYSVTNTCNQWTSNTLAAAGIKTGWWTPLAGGVMKWVPSLDNTET